MAFILGIIVLQGMYNLQNGDMIIDLTITHQNKMAGSLANCAIGNNRKLVIRLMVGAWCFACFVLITAYSSVLISFLTAPDTYKPIINSISELPKKPFIRVTVDKGFFPDYLFQVCKIF